MFDQPDELDQLVRRALDAHAAAAAEPTGTIDAVWRGVARRAHRRRRVATIGSVAMIAAGIGGIALLANDRGTGQNASGAPTGSAETTAPAVVEGTEFVTTTTTMFPDVVGAVVWACSNLLSSHGDTYYFAHCEQTSRGAVDVGAAPIFYIVQGDETLDQIAAYYGTSAALVAETNGWPEGVGHQLSAGEQIILPAGLTLPAEPLCTIAPTTTSTTVPGLLPPPTTPAPCL